MFGVWIVQQTSVILSKAFDEKNHIETCNLHRRISNLHFNRFSFGIIDLFYIYSLKVKTLNYHVIGKNIQLQLHKS